MKQLLVMLMALVVLLAACEGGAQTETRTSTETSSEDTSAETSAEADVRTNTETVSNDLRALLAAGRSAKCTFTTENGQVTMYMAGMKQRAEVNAQGTMAYMISDGTTMYSWAGDQGVKYNLADMQEFAAQYEGQSQSPPPSASDYADVAADVRCSAWSPSGDSFTPPSNIEFQDMAALLQQMQQYQSQMPDY